MTYAHCLRVNIDSQDFGGYFSRIDVRGGTLSGRLSFDGLTFRAPLRKITAAKVGRYNGRRTATVLVPTVIGGVLALTVFLVVGSIIINAR